MTSTSSRILNRSDRVSITNWRSHWSVYCEYGSEHCRKLRTSLVRSDADVDGRPDPIRAWRSEVYTGPNAREESVATPHDRGSIASERASACARANDRLGTHEEMSSERSIRYAWFYQASAWVSLGWRRCCVRARCWERTTTSNRVVDGVACTAWHQGSLTDIRLSLSEHLWWLNKHNILQWLVHHQA